MAKRLGLLLRHIKQAELSKPIASWLLQALGESKLEPTENEDKDTDAHDADEDGEDEGEEEEAAESADEVKQTVHAAHSSSSAAKPAEADDCIVEFSHELRQAVRRKRIGNKGKHIITYTSDFIKHTELSGDHPIEARWEDGFRSFVKGATQALIWPLDFDEDGGGGEKTPGPGGKTLPNTSSKKKKKKKRQRACGQGRLRAAAH